MNLEETKGFFQSFFEKYNSNDVEVGFCVPFVSISLAQELNKDKKIKIGAQNVSAEVKGAFTGEISTDMLKDYNIDYIIIGHSERRELYKEDNEMIRCKFERVLSQRLTPILCIGETLEEREENKTEEKLALQLETAFANIDAEDALKTILAYEPIWAIGTGKTATKEQADETIGFIRGWIEKRFSSEVSEKIRIQYGGSVKPGNVKELMAMPNIDGALVGGASLNAEDFLKIVNYKE